MFERATHRGPIFCGEIETSRLKLSSEIEFFDRGALWAPFCGATGALWGLVTPFSRSLLQESKQCLGRTELCQGVVEKPQIIRNETTMWHCSEEF